MNTLLDVLSTVGRVVIHTRGLIRCGKELYFIYKRLYPEQHWPLWSLILKEEYKDDSF